MRTGFRAFSDSINGRQPCTNETVGLSPDPGNGDWIFLRLVEKVEGGATKKLDEQVLRMLRHKHNPALPRGPKWLPQVAQDVTSLGSGSNLTLASGIAVGFLCLQRRFRAAGLLIVSIGGELMLSHVLKNFFLRERPTGSSTSDTFRSW